MALHLGKLYGNVKEKCNDEIELAAGDAGLNNVVRWIRMVDNIEIARSFEENEVIFTADIALNLENGLLDLVKKVYKCGASGIVINIECYIKEISQEVNNFCNEKSIPLFVVSHQSEFARVIKIFADEIILSEKRNIEITLAVKNAIYYPNNYNLYVQALESYGYCAEWMYCMAVCECTDKNGGDVESSILENIKISIENAIIMLVLSGIVFLMENQIEILFYNTDEKKIEDNVNNIIKFIPNSLKERVNIYIGVGRNVKGICCINDTFSIAAKIVWLQKKKKANDKVMLYQSLGISRLFLMMNDEKIMNDFYGEVLEPLVKYDEENHTNLIDFLKVYFTNGGHVRETASEMYLHRNSINYKLRKIEEILGCDFSDINNKAQILVALKLMEFL